LFTPYFVDQHIGMHSFKILLTYFISKQDNKKGLRRGVVACLYSALQINENLTNSSRIMIINVSANCSHYWGNTNHYAVSCQCFRVQTK